MMIMIESFYFLSNFLLIMILYFTVLVLWFGFLFYFLSCHYI